MGRSLARSRLCAHADCHADAYVVSVGEVPTHPMTGVEQRVATDQEADSCWVIHAAIWARELNPILRLMLATCRAAVAGAMNKARAISGLLLPLLTSNAISYSRWVRRLRGWLASAEEAVPEEVLSFCVRCVRAAPSSRGAVRRRDPGWRPSSDRSSASWTASDKPSERPCCHQRPSACCCCPSSSVPVNGQGAEKVRRPSCSRTAVAAPASRQARSRSPCPNATRAMATKERATSARCPAA